MAQQELYAIVHYTEADNQTPSNKSCRSDNFSLETLNCANVALVQGCSNSVCQVAWVTEFLYCGTQHLWVLIVKRASCHHSRA
jgi:hypothetical protein